MQDRKLIRFKMAPEAFNRLMNAAQYLADIAEESGNAELGEAALSAMSDAMNHSALLDQHIDKETGAVEAVSFAAGELTMRNVFAIAELGPDAAKSGYARDYIAVLFEQQRQRHMAKIEEHLEKNKVLACAWGEFRDAHMDGADGDPGLIGEFCVEQGISPRRFGLLRPYLDAAADARGKQVTVRAPGAARGEQDAGKEQG